MHTASVKLATLVLRQHNRETDRIANLFEHALSRQPNGRDLESVRAFLKRAWNQNPDNKDEPWRLLARTLLASNEFAYIQ